VLDDRANSRGDALVWARADDVRDSGRGDLIGSMSGGITNLFCPKVPREAGGEACEAILQVANH
jgi:hypothetical protein